LIEIDGSSLSIEQVVKIARFKEKVPISKKNRELVKKSAAVVKSFVDENKVVYGITTGFGNFANVRIPKEKVRDLQKMEELVSKQSLIKEIESELGKLH
jgi:histidine ammonia-lyase